MELIVLNTTKTGDSSLVVHALSREYGRRSFITATGKPGSMALYLPLNILEAEAVENRKSELWRMKGTVSEYPLSGLRGSMAKNSICMFMSEVLYRAVREGTEEGLYDWCRRSILTLDAMDNEFSNYHLRFLLELAVCMGFSPGVPDLVPFVGEHAAQTEKLLRLDFASCMLIRMNGKTRSDIAEGLVRYLGYHLDFPLNIRSLPVLRELFGTD